MRIAVAYDNGLIYPHFSRSPRFKIYDFAGRQLIGTHIVQGWRIFGGSMADLIKELDVHLLICDNIGFGTRIVLAACGVEIRDRMTGDADRAVADATGLMIGLVPPPIEPLPRPAPPPKPKNIPAPMMSPGMKVIPRRKEARNIRYQRPVNPPKPPRGERKPTGRSSRGGGFTGRRP